ncbi:hypothetical protein GCM10025785_20300 [Corynebacterium canis]
MFLQKHHRATTGVSNLPDRGLWADSGSQLATPLGVVVSICLLRVPWQICLRQIRRGLCFPKQTRHKNQADPAQARQI